MTTQLMVSAGDAKLAMKIEGDGSLPWLIISNSLATNMSMWDDQISELTKLRRVVRYDTRGHGASTASPGPHSFDMLTHDIISIMNHLKIPSADILGLSLGGMTALGLGLAHPNRVNNIICCSARADFPPPVIASWDERIKAVTDGGMAAIVEGTLSRWFTEKTRNERPEIANRARQMITSTSVDGYRGCAGALKTLDYRRRLPEMKRTVFYLAGSADGAASPDAMREMAEATPKSNFEIIPDAAHITNMECAQLFNQKVCNFIRGLDVK
jgi:3-oxoadipate enol-lactonase